MEGFLDSMDGVADEAAGLTDVPTLVLKDQVLPFLDFRTLCALACAGSPLLRDICEADALWEPLANANSWGRLDQETWKQAYKRQKAELCTCCQKRTKYLFAITGCRLCEACEHANPHRYSLVTACEATEHYGLSAVNLLNLKGPLKKLGTSFYLRCEVAQAAAAAVNSEDSYLDCRDLGGEGDSDDGGENDDRVPASLSDGPNCKASSCKQGREEKRAARKANKKQVKQLNREKRIIGSSPPASGSLGCSPQFRGGSFGSSPHGGQYLGVTPSSASHRRKAPSSNSRRRPHVRQSKEVTDGPSMRAVSTCSPWIQERERLMSEFGEFGISGLVLA